MADPPHGGLPFELDKPFNWDQVENSERLQRGQPPLALMRFSELLSAATAEQRAAILAAMEAGDRGRFAAALVAVYRQVLAAQGIVTVNVQAADP